MTEYSDLTAVNALHVESQLIVEALANLEAGGTLQSMYINPPPPVPFDPNVPPPAPPAIPLRPVNIIVPQPVDAVLLADITASLNARLTEIAAELTAFGVTVPPPGDAQWAAQSALGGPPSFYYPPPLMSRRPQ